jgi:hypothetical protein
MPKLNEIAKGVPVTAFWEFAAGFRPSGVRESSQEWNGLTVMVEEPFPEAEGQWWCWRLECPDGLLDYAGGYGSEYEALKEMWRVLIATWSWDKS